MRSLVTFTDAASLCWRGQTLDWSGLKRKLSYPWIRFHRGLSSEWKGNLLSHSSEPGVLSYKTRAQSPTASETANRKVEPLNLGRVLNSRLGLEMLAAQILPQEIRWTGYWVYYSPVSKTTDNNLTCIFMPGTCPDNKHSRLRSQYFGVEISVFKISSSRFTVPPCSIH